MCFLSSFEVRGVRDAEGNANGAGTLRGAATAETLRLKEDADCTFLPFDFGGILCGNAEAIRVPREDVVKF